jgi:hypothetical protein
MIRDARRCALLTMWDVDRIEDIRKRGKVEVSLAGRPFHITRDFLDDISPSKG